MTTFTVRHRFRVRYSEVDPQGVVFNSRYLEYADLAVVEYFRALALPPEMVDFHVGTAVVRYLHPIRMDELIEARVRIDRFGTASMTWSIELHGDETDDQRATIELVYVNVDLATGKSQPLPDTFKRRVRTFQGG